MARTIVVHPIANEDQKMPGQMKIYGIKCHGVWGFEVPDPDPHQPAHVFEFKRNVRKSWHAALAYAREHHDAPKQQPINMAQLIEIGYETGGDFDEALRVYVEREQTERRAVLVPDDLTDLKAAWADEFEWAFVMEAKA